MNVTEATSATPLNSDLKAGLRALDRLQELTFTKYVRLVLPADGFVFWVKADMWSGDAGFNSLIFGTTAINGTDRTITQGAPTVTVRGSLHYSTNNQQELDQTIGLNSVVFTSESDIDDFNDIGESVLYIAEWDGIQFAFSQRGSFYSQVGLFHYTGEAIHPAMRSQIIDDIRFFDRTQIVSNSLPIFMMLNKYFPCYPSFLVKQNCYPPYAAIDIVETTAIAGQPTESANSSRWQQCQDKVRLTTYGINNNTVLDYIWYVVASATGDTKPPVNFDLWDAYGIMNMPVPKDEKRPQSELNVIAQKKTIEFDVNYLQNRTLNIARQLILSAIPSVIINQS